MLDRSGGVVLVAGGAGFLGSHLCDALIARGRHVICLDNFLTGSPDNVAHLMDQPRFDLVEADIIRPLPPLPPVDRIYNLACPASPPHYQADPIHTMLTNVVGTFHLLRLAERYGARFLLASTSEVYGDPDQHPQPEAYRGNVSSTGPRACYDEGKRAAEALAFDYARADRANVRVARIFNTYGPRMQANDGRVVSNVITQALSGAPLTVYGDGSQTRSFCYVADLIDGLMRLMEEPGRCVGPVNLGNPQELTVSELVEKVLMMTGSRSRVMRRSLPTDDPRRRRPDITLARKMLGWSPKTDLGEGLDQTISWFRLHSTPSIAELPSQPVASRGMVRTAALRRGAEAAANAIPSPYWTGSD